MSYIGGFGPSPPTVAALARRAGSLRHRRVQGDHHHQPETNPMTETALTMQAQDSGPTLTPSLREALAERVDDSALHPSGWVALVPAGPLAPDTLDSLRVDLAERLSLPCHLPDARDGLGGLDPEDVTLVYDDGAGAELWLERVPASSEAIREAQEMCQPCALARYRASSDWCIDGEYQYTHGHPPEGSLECPRHRGEDPYLEGDTETLEVGAAALGLRPLRMPALLAETAETAPVLALVHREAVERYEASEETVEEVKP